MNQVKANLLYAVALNENSKSVYASGTFNGNIDSNSTYVNVVYSLNYTANSASVKYLSSPNLISTGDKSKSLVADNLDNIIVSTSKSSEQSLTKILKTTSLCFPTTPPTVASLSSDSNWYSSAIGDTALTSSSSLTEGQIVVWISHWFYNQSTKYAKNNLVVLALQFLQQQSMYIKMPMEMAIEQPKQIIKLLVL